MTGKALQRYNRLAQAKLRGSKQSYKTQLENVQILLAWASEELTEGQAAKALGVSRLEARDMMYESRNTGVGLAKVFMEPIKHHAQTIADAEVELEEIAECGDLEDVLDAAFKVEDMKSARQ